MRKFFMLLLVPVWLAAAQTERVPPAQIEKELSDAQQQYEHALKLFNPWYTGPLITPSTTMEDPGCVMLQPYIFLIDNYAMFDAQRHSVHAPNRFTLQVQPVIFQTGITPSVDTTITVSTQGNWQQGASGGGLNDLRANLGFLIATQGVYTPGAKLTITQVFPTGPYKNLNPHKFGLSGIGGGAWQTQFTLTLGKVLFWNTLHPVNTRLSFNYQIATPIWVTNFNTYGGGYGTKGVVHPGSQFAVDLGLELSLSQPWALALDVVYNNTNRTTFHGHNGVTDTGEEAFVGSGYSDQLSLAPAIEYNFTDKMGVVGGVWFTVYGRNASNFVSGVFTWYWTFP